MGTRGENDNTIIIHSSLYNYLNIYKVNQDAQQFSHKHEHLEQTLLPWYCLVQGCVGCKDICLDIILLSTSLTEPTKIVLKMLENLMNSV
jgi:hypothetical protein